VLEQAVRPKPMESLDAACLASKQAYLHGVRQTVGQYLVNA
jgi:hypothetical protein